MIPKHASVWCKKVSIGRVIPLHLTPDQEWQIGENRYMNFYI